MDSPSPFRHSLTFKAFVLYLVPVLFYSIYVSTLIPAHDSWNAVSIGLLLSGVCSLVLFWVSYQAEKFQGQKKQETVLEQGEVTNKVHFPPSETPLSNLSPELPYMSLLEQSAVDQSTILSAHNKEKELVADIERKNEELQKFYRERNQWLKNEEQLKEDVSSYERKMQENSAIKDKLEADFLKTITDQREVLEQREQQILKLESQVRDLTYEIKTLIHLDGHNKTKSARIEENSAQLPLPLVVKSNIPPPLYQPTTSKSLHNSSTSLSKRALAPPSIEANLQLKKCIDIAQKITGTALFGSETSRFRDLSVNSYSIDLRRLFDSLRSETSMTIILYSQKEDKLLFANNQSKNLSGWSPEKFVQDFPQLIQEGMAEWKKGLAQLVSKNETQVSLLLKAKSGQTISVNCHLGIIPTGIFRSHVIGVLY